MTRKRKIRQARHIVLALLLIIVGVGSLFMLTNDQPAQAVGESRPFPQEVDYGNGFTTDAYASADALETYNHWKSKYLKHDCSNQDWYRVEFSTPGETVSEGIGYGMILTAYHGDREEFDGLWAFAKSKWNDRGLMSWRVTCDTVVGAGDASDGDLDMALGLLIAWNQWGDAYQQDAIDLIYKMKAQNYQWCPNTGRWLQKNGNWGGCDNSHTSYWMPGYYKVFKEFTGDPFWDEVYEDTYEVFFLNRHPVTGFNSNQATEDGGVGRDENYVDYNGARTPWRLVTDYLWYGSNDAKDMLDRLVGWGYDQGPSNLVDGYYVDGTIRSTGNWKCSTPFTGAWASGAMAVSQPVLDDFVAHDKQCGVYDNYYSTSLGALYRLVMTGNFWKPSLDGPLPTPIPPTPTITPSPTPPDLINLNKPVTVSSIESQERAGELAVDGSGDTRWASERSDPQWLYVDLEGQYDISRVQIHWEGAYGRQYKIQVSDDANTWTDVFTEYGGDGGLDDITLSATGRYVRMYGQQRGTQWGYSMWEFHVFGVPAGQPTNTPAPGTPEPTAVPGSCVVDYNVVNEWSNGFTADVTITNNSSTPIQGWNLQWSYTDGQQVTSAWNADAAQSGSNVTISQVASHWNGTIGANGGSVNFGFQATKSGGNSSPASFILNGSSCNGDVPTPVPPTNTPVPPTDVPPTDVPPTDVPPTDVPPTDVPPTDVPPTDVPPTDVPPTDVPPTDVPPTNTPTPGGSCSVAYTVANDWGSGATVNVTISSETAVNGWTLDWTFPGNQTISNLWNGSFSQSGADVSVSNLSWNGNIAPNGSVSVGFNMSYSGSNSVPATFVLNGETCN